MNVEELIKDKNIHGLKQLIKSCDESELFSIKCSIIKSGLMSARSVGVTIGHRPGRKPISDESRKRYGEASRNAWINGTSRETRARTDSKPETHKRRSEATIKARSKDSTKQRQSEAQKIAQNRPEVKLAKSVASTKFLKELWKDPEYQKKQSIAQSKASRESAASGYWNFRYLLQGKSCILQSTYELLFVQQLSRKGISVRRSKLKIPWIDHNGVTHHYHPDFEYELNGKTHIVEVKPSGMIKGAVLLKAEAAIRYLPEDHKYEFFTQDSIENWNIDYSDPNLISYKSSKRHSKWILAHPTNE